MDKKDEEFGKKVQRNRPQWCGGLTLIDEHLRINDPMHYYDYWMDLRQHESSIFQGKRDPDLNEPLLKLAVISAITH